ncbi:MAG: DUF1670 domain-containing protein [bacterium]|nr:DUF1670 domain-containing protein [bacterium]
MMVRKPDYVRKKFDSQKAKTLHNALAHKIAKEFPRLGGRRICDLCAEMILEVVNRHMQPLERVHHGQVVWAAVSIDDPPRRHQRIADTDLVPVVLELSNSEDIDGRVNRKLADQRMLDKALRLCQQAHQQGGLLSNCDLAEMLTTAESRIAHLLAEHEREQGQIVPRRATLHDVGSGITHKRIICRMRYVGAKEPHLIARLTHHSLEAVDRYLSQYDRVRHCRLQSLTPQETAHALACSVKLVQEYLDIDQQLEAENGRK